MSERPTDPGNVEARLGYRFRRPRLLQRALTHRSFAHEGGEDPAESYERLEFLGDALLGFVVAHRLWKGDRLAPEGTLTRRKQAVVRTATLADAARRLGLGEDLRLGRGEQLTGGRNKASLLADAFEAVLGAVYVDGGIRAATSFVGRHLGQAMRDAAAVAEVVDDYKTRLQEKVQGELRRTPAYRIVAREGPAHRPDFVAEVRVGRRVLAQGRGSSRKDAEQDAARNALEVK